MLDNPKNDQTQQDDASYNDQGSAGGMSQGSAQDTEIKSELENDTADDTSEV